MEVEEIVLPQTTPETEWVRGRALQKVSPRRSHARVQIELASLLNAWSRGRGEVGTEWRFRIAVPGEARRPLVPDIAFVAAERLAGFSGEELEAPPFAPTVAIEIRSLGDAQPDVESKISVYLRGGSSLVIIVDPQNRTALLCDGNVREMLAGNDTLRHDALPDFSVPLAEFFERALRVEF